MPTKKKKKYLFWKRTPKVKILLWNQFTVDDYEFMNYTNLTIIDIESNIFKSKLEVSMPGIKESAIELIKKVPQDYTIIDIYYKGCKLFGEYFLSLWD